MKGFLLVTFLVWVNFSYGFVVHETENFEHQLNLIVPNKTNQIQYMESHLEKGVDLTFEEVHSGFTKNRKKIEFDAHNPNIIGYSGKPIWVRYKVLRQEEEKQHTLFENLYFIEFYSLINDIKVWVLIDGKVVSRFIGGYKAIPSSEFSPLKRPTHYLVQEIPSNKEVEIYFRVQHRGTIHTTSHIQSFQWGLKKNLVLGGLYFFLFGIFFAMLIYNAVLFYRTKMMSYFYYLSYLLSFASMIFVRDNHFSNFVGIPLEHGDLIVSMTYSSTVIWSGIFGIHFLRFKDRFPKLRILLLFLFGMIIPMQVLNFIDLTKIFQTYIAVTMIFGSTTFFICSCYLLNRGVKTVLYYMLSWTSLFVAVTFYTISLLLIPRLVEVSVLAIYGAAAIEMVLLSLALGHQYSSMRKHVENAMQKTYENKRLKNLVRVLCHDIVNPLGVIKLQASMKLKKLVNDDEERLGWERIWKAVEIQENIISHVREIESIKSNKMVLDLYGVNLMDTIDQAKFVFSEKLSQKNISVTVKCLDLCPILAEKVSLEQSVINNVISNAIKFSYENSVISIVGKRKGGNYALEIQDSGTGIREEQLEKIFEDYSATTTVGTKGEKGTGFGMSLIRTYMRMYGGRVDIESNRSSVEQNMHKNGTKVTLLFKVTGDQYGPHG
ncbi:sensor histidine kinase [Bacteriovoracaceae bacterium]|nr:sensor histidine kinase [Bacteriovoracaceae bacterium]